MQVRVAADAQVLKDEMLKLKAEQTKLGAGTPESPGARSPASHSSVASTRAGPRAGALLGGIGWETEEAQLVLGGNATLDAAGVPEGQWHAMAAACRPGSKGSMVTVHFREEAHLEVAIYIVRALSMSHPDASGVAWLSIKKSFAERRPTRQAKLMHQLIWDYIEKKEGLAKDNVTLDVRTRSVSVKGVKLAWLDRDGYCTISLIMGEILVAIVCSELDRADGGWLLVTSHRETSFVRLS